MEELKNKIKTLYRTKDNRVVAGVLGGLGEYFQVDANVLRLLFLIITIFTGFVPGVLVYIIAALIIPEH